MGMAMISAHKECPKNQDTNCSFRAEAKKAKVPSIKKPFTSWMPRVPIIKARSLYIMADTMKISKTILT
jgi:hypothetical protein